MPDNDSRDAYIDYVLAGAPPLTDAQRAVALLAPLDDD
jgi:hypothetical protein